MEEHVNKLRKHRTFLYCLVVLLLALQTASFIALSSQVSNLQGELVRSNNELNSSFVGLLEESEAETLSRFNDVSTTFQEISRELSEQQEDFDEEIALLKSSKADFSGIIEDAVKSVVSVGTDRSVGTGFFVNGNGYIVTNYHVIEGGSRVSVLTFDKQAAFAQVVGVDTNRDIALLKVNADYPALDLATSNEVQVGKKVIAIGNPLGLSFSVTEGIVSAVDRVGPNGLEEYVQTDVSLNPGNSGGPLIDTSGNVIGLNNFKVGGAEGLGFSLESSVVKQTVNSIANQTIVA